MQVTSPAAQPQESLAAAAGNAAKANAKANTIIFFMLYSPLK
jgi:hypothetical protein